MPVCADFVRKALELQRTAALLRSKPGCDVEDLSDAIHADMQAADLLESAQSIAKVRNTRRMRIRYGDMPHPRYSMWRHLLKLGPESNGAWVRFCGVSRTLYDELDRIAQAHPDYKGRFVASHLGQPHPRGRPMLMGSQDAIGLALRYMIGMSETVGLMSGFYVSSETICAKLHEGLTLLLWALERHPDAAVRWPTKEEQAVYAAVICSHGGDKLPADLCTKLPFVWVDGFAVAISKPADKELERMWFAHKHGTTVASNLFAFTPDGLIAWYNVNVPGSVNDTEACKELTSILHDRSRTIADGVCLGDVAFRGETSGANEVYLTPATTHHFTATTTVGDALTLGYWVLGRRQAVEWSVQNFRRTFRRLATELHADPVHREAVLKIATHLHQLRVRHGSRTQLGTVYWAASQVGRDAADEVAHTAAAAAAITAAASATLSSASAAAASLPCDEDGEAAWLEVLADAVAEAEAADVAALHEGLDDERDDADEDHRRKRSRRAGEGRRAKRARGDDTDGTSAMDE